MMGTAVLNKTEIDVLQANELADACSLAAKHCMPAIVVHGSLAGQAIAARGRMNGQFKLIIPVDWPKGEERGMNKMRGMTTDAMEADGYEFLLSVNTSPNEAKREIADLSKFVDDHLGSTTECRFVVGAHSRPEAVVDCLCNAFVGMRSPAMIRSDILHKAPSSKINTTEHSAFITKMKKIFPLPIKVCGNITGARIMNSCLISAARCGVNLQQVKVIITEIQQQPDAVRGLLDTPSSDVIPPSA